MSGRPWSLAEDAAVLLGPPYWPVAKCAGRSLAAVQQRAHRLRTAAELERRRAEAMEWANDR